MSGYQPFETEHYFARYEFTTRHLLASSDCESMTIAELLERSGGSLAELGSLELGYTESQGSPSLRDAIAARYELVAADDVIVLNSPIEGIYLTMRTLLAPGDEVVALAPSYDALRNLPEDIGGSVRLWRMREVAGEWTLPLDELDELLTPHTKLVVLNFPHNPTGYLPTPEEFDAILERVARSGAWLYHDEIFRGTEHGTHPRLVSAADRLERSLVLGGLSKSHGLPGLRAGWLVVRDPDLRADVMNTKMYTSICPPAPVEYLATKALSIADELEAANRQLIRSNLESAERFFGRHRHRFRFLRPRAGPVALVGVEGGSAAALCAAAVDEAGVMLLPSTSLGLGDGHVRFGFGHRSFGEGLAALDRHLSAVG